jgi:hypothetical protein
MKKLLLLLVATCFIFVANAQKATEAVKMDQKKLLYDSEYQGAVPPAAINYSNDARDSREKILVGRAHSQRSFRREDCKVISYNKDLDLISISFILDKETYPSIALSDGSVGIFYSADHGQTWAGPVFLSDFSAEGLRNYYLSGVLYNPTDNTVIEDAYGVYQGVPPDDPALVLWNKQAFGTSTLGGANYLSEYFENSGPNEYDGYFNQLGLTQIQDFMKCLNIWAEGPWAAFTALKMEDIQGVYNGTGFDWELEHSVIDMPFNIDPSDNSAIWCGKWTFSDVAADMVWSDDGEIGYAWMVGATSENLESGYQPIIFKTTDGGNIWDYVELDFQQSQWQNFFQNGATDPADWLILPCRNLDGSYADYTIPWFDETAGAVDDAGNLQLFGAVSSHYSDFIHNGFYYDSIGFRYNFCGNLFKFTIGDELIDIMLVDTLFTNGARDLVGTETSDSLYCKTNGWLHRLQVTKDERSEEFFVTWSDSEPGDRVQPNYRPDIKGWSYNITTGTHTDPVCFTCGTTFPFEHYWFVQAADQAYYNSVDETFTVPMVNAVSLNDFYSNVSGSADPIDVEYVTGITFDAIDPIHVGVDEIPGLSSMSVSQNLPNPATGITTIKISSETVAPVTVEVSNLIGQTVHTINAGVINGNMSVKIDVSNLEAGVYFYTVIIANERVSKRMIVR